MVVHVLVNRLVVDSILTYAKIQHPREGILLLEGKTGKNEIHVKEVIIPPFAVHGYGFSTFPMYMSPMSSSIVGTAHSHPSGVLQPSIEDLNHFYSRIMVITAYPYDSENQMAIYDRDGKAVEYEIVDEK